MNMITSKDYDNFLDSISNRIKKYKNFKSYAKFEKDWTSYFISIFLKKFDKNKPLRIFIAESAPSGHYPNANYIFDTATLRSLLDNKRDMYLSRYLKGICPIYKGFITKEDALILLAEENVLIIDLLPTHGIKLKTGERKKIESHISLVGHPISSVISTNLKKIKISSTVVNYAFSVPPSLYAGGMLILKGKDFGNVNIGQGHAPSIKEIKKIVASGF